MAIILQSLILLCTSIVSVFGFAHLNSHQHINEWQQFCKKPHSCSNNTLRQAIVTGGGYKSIDGINTIISSHEVECDGAYSCNGIHSINSSFIMCSGDNSCSDSENDLSASNGIACYGANSCAYSSIVSEYELECGGSHSCAHSHINQIHAIYGKGAYSLYNAIINAEYIFHDTLDIYFYGYQAGYNTIILCDNKDVQCNIHCFGNGCFKTKLVCLYDNCNLFCDELDVNCPTELDFDHNYSVNELIEYINSNEDRLLLNDSKYMIVDSLHTSEHADSSCSYDEDSVKLDDYHSHTTIDPYLTEGSMCFRGAFTSNLAHLRELQSLVRKKRFSDSEYQTIVQHNREKRHEKGSMTTVRGIGGPRGHYKGKNNDNFNLFKWNNKHHNGGIIGDIVCSGTGSCYGSAMHLKHSKAKHRRLLCSGTSACGESDIYAHDQDIIYCSGENSCENSQIYNASVVYCDGDESCRASELYGVSGIFRLNGFDLNSQSIIRHNPLLSSSIDYEYKRSLIVSNGIGHMTVNLLSYKSGFNLDIICNKSDICDINCGTHGACMNTNVYCSGDCHISCVAEIQEHCPIVTKSDKLNNNDITTTAATAATATNINDHDSNKFNRSTHHHIHHARPIADGCGNGNWNHTERSECHNYTNIIDNNDSNNDTDDTTNEWSFCGIFSSILY